MKKVQFEFPNGVIYPGLWPGEDFMGKSLVYAAPETLAQIMKDLRDGFGTRQPSRTIVERIKSLEPRYSWKEVSLWNMGCRVVRNVDLFEVEDRSEAADADSYERSILEGHYFDIVINGDRDLVDGSQRFIDRSRVETFIGRYDDVASAIAQATERGASERQRNRLGEYPEDVTSGLVHRRLFANATSRCLPLSAVVSELPTYKTSVERAACRTWACSVEKEAMRKNPDVCWFGGVSALMDSIDLLSAVPSGSA